MKPAAFIPPAAVVIAGTIWLATQTASISRLKTENSVLLERIAAHTTRPDPEAPERDESPRAAPTGNVKKARDWKTLALQMAEMRRPGGGMGDMRAIMKSQQILEAMGAEEIAAGLDEISRMELPESFRRAVEQMLLGQLVEKDIELALRRFIGRTDEDNGSVGWILANGVKRWADKDPSEVAAWLDGQIASGSLDSKSLDGKNEARLHFEAALISALLPSDPAQAAARLSAMPEEHRKDLLGESHFQALDEDGQVAFARLVRGQVLAADQAEVVVGPVGQIVSNGGFAAASTFLDRVEATPAERAMAVEQALSVKASGIAFQRKLTIADIDEMRAWGATQAPAQVEQSTGAILGNLAMSGDKNDFAHAAELALHYHEASGNDEVLGTFLESWTARSNRDLAASLAEKISDPDRRERILKSFVK